ncbi:MAG: succinate dehydrogenase / fumarate reductase membrane anchor subunit [Glaciecola sp.]|jgi:succinate dehydrogenase / fumarate reductase membrane anchor subunit|uniref:succinate dehydrogenase, hydrophobic membrane anchor protein n=1 Tax=Congregibacter sp. TaxID=2744308 RepID=UPI0039E2F05C
MVAPVTSLTRSGLSDWLVQRVTAVILLAFFVFLGFKIATGMSYLEWSMLFAQTWMKTFTLLAILSLAAHAWIGMWGVFTDYLTERLMGSRGNGLRIGLQLLTSLSLVIYVIWGIQVVWA